MVADRIGLLLAVLEASVGEEETLAFMHLLPRVNLPSCKIIDRQIGPAFQLLLTYLASCSLRSDKAVTS